MIVSRIAISIKKSQTRVMSPTWRHRLFPTCFPLQEQLITIQEQDTIENNSRCHRDDFYVIFSSGLSLSFCVKFTNHPSHHISCHWSCSQYVSYSIMVLVFYKIDCSLRLHLIPVHFVKLDFLSKIIIADTHHRWWSARMEWKTIARSHIWRRL